MSVYRIRATGLTAVTIWPAYWLVSLDMRYRISREVSVYERTDNIFNRDYKSVYGYNQPGRGVYVGVNLTM